MSLFLIGWQGVAGEGEGQLTINCLNIDESWIAHFFPPSHFFKIHINPRPIYWVVSNFSFHNVFQNDCLCGPPDVQFETKSFWQTCWAVLSQFWTLPALMQCEFGESSSAQSPRSSIKIQSFPVFPDPCRPKGLCQYEDTSLSACRFQDCDQGGT